MKKALFWDFDGTLVHPNQSFFDALQTALKAQNYFIPEDELWALLKSSCSWYNYDITYPDKTGAHWWRSLFEKFDALFDKYEIAQTLRKTIEEDFREQILSGKSYVLFDDAKDVLAQCMEMGYQNYVISNNYPELTEIIYTFDLAPYFTEYFVSANLGYEKPRQEIFQYALEAAGNPGICYMIGDNSEADILGGKAVGMKTILVHHDDRYEEDFNCKTLTEILKILK